MFNYYFNIGIIYILIGLVAAFAVIFVFKKKIIGRFWGALFVAVIGSFLGGFFDFIFGDVIEYLSNLNGSVNIFPAIITSVILLLILSRISDKRK